MKTSSILAILALLGIADGAKTVKTLLERAQEDDDISQGKMDVGYVGIGSKHKHKKHRHHKPKHQELVQSEPRVTNDGRPLDQVRQSADQTGQDQSDRKTDTMFEADKHYEDSFYQGAQNTGGHGGEQNTGQKNAPGISDLAPVPWHTLPKKLDKLAPTNMPEHKHAGDFKAATTKGSSSTGIYLVFLTVDNEEHASRFVKDLFRLGLVAAVEMQEGGFDRSYLKFGRISTEKGRTRLQMTTGENRVEELIDYINNENPTHYDYPVPNTTVLPVSIANEGYVAWVKKQTSTEAGKIKYDAKTAED